MRRFLLDTNILSEPAKPRPNAGVLRRLEQHAGALTTATVVWHELWFGIERLTPGRRRDYLSAYVEEVVAKTVTLLPYDEAAARCHAAQRARLASLGETPPFADGQIAAIAAVHNLVLVTRNTDDFRSFPSVVVENWFQPA